MASHPPSPSKDKLTVGARSRYAAYVIGSAHKLLVSLALLSSASLSSCDTFRGSLVALTITWPFYPPVCTDAAMTMPPGCQPLPQPALLPTSAQHLEMWGKFSTGEIRRLVANVGTNDPSTFTGFTILPALAPNDPCLVRALDRDDQDCVNATLSSNICGAPLFSKKAHTGPDISDNDALLLQQQLVLQGRKITSKTTPFLAVDAGMTTGNTFGPLLTLAQWNPDFATDPRTKDMSLAVSVASAMDPAVSAQRIQKCTLYRDGDGTNANPPHPYFYVGNPHQITKPLSGVQFGFLGFSTGPGSLQPDLPAQNFNGMSFYLPWAADDMVQLVITLDARPPATAALDANAIQLFLAQRLPDISGGRGVIRMVVLANSTPPLAPGPVPAPTFLPTSAVGTISILTGLDSGIN